MIASPARTTEVTAAAGSGGRPRGVAGFTLVEVLLVLLILGVLTSIAILAYDPFEELAGRERDVIEDAESRLLDDSDLAGPLPVDLPDPIRVGALSLSLPPGNSTTGESLEVVATATDEDGEPMPQVQVRFEISGVHDLVGVAETDGAGTATFSYDGTTAGVDTITACTDEFGRLPASCDSATGPSISATRTWVDPPEVVAVTQSHGGGPGNLIVVTWNEPVTAAGPVSGYRLYDSAGCDAASLQTQGTLRLQFEDDVVQITMADEWDATAPRWLQVEPGTEGNAENATNALSECLELEVVLTPDPPQLVSATQTHEVGSGDEVVVTWNEPVLPLGPVSGYQLYATEDECIALTEPSEGTGRIQFDGDLVRISFTDGWDAGEDPPWLRVEAGAEENVNGVANLRSACLAVQPAPGPDPPHVVNVMQTHDAGTGDALVIAWSDPVLPLGPVSGYQLYATEEECDEPTDPDDVNEGVQRLRFDGNLVRVSLADDWDASEPRWLRVVAGTEASAFGVENDPSPCLLVQPPPPEDPPEVVSVRRTHLEGLGSRIVVTWSSPVAGLGEVAGYRLYDDEEACEDRSGANPGTTRVRFDGDLVRITLTDGWDAEEDQPWLRVEADTEENVHGVPNGLTDCRQVTAP